MNKKKSTHDLGSETEAIVLAELKGHGLTVSVPFGRPRYDFVVEMSDGSLKKAQVKTGSYNNGSVIFDLQSSHVNSSRNKHMSYSEDEVDVFILYSPDTGDVYWVPFEEAPDTKITLRVKEPENKHPSIRWANEYEISTIV